MYLWTSPMTWRYKLLLFSLSFHINTRQMRPQQLHCFFLMHPCVITPNVGKLSNCPTACVGLMPFGCELSTSQQTRSTICVNKYIMCLLYQHIKIIHKLTCLINMFLVLTKKDLTSCHAKVLPASCIALISASQWGGRLDWTFFTAILGKQNKTSLKTPDFKELVIDYHWKWWVICPSYNFTGTHSGPKSPDITLKWFSDVRRVSTKGMTWLPSLMASTAWSVTLTLLGRQWRRVRTPLSSKFWLMYSLIVLVNVVVLLL